MNLYKTAKWVDADMNTRHLALYREYNDHDGQYFVWEISGSQDQVIGKTEREAIEKAKKHWEGLVING